MNNSCFTSMGWGRDLVSNGIWLKKAARSSKLWRVTQLTTAALLPNYSSNQRQHDMWSNSVKCLTHKNSLFFSICRQCILIDLWLIKAPIARTCLYSVLWFYCKNFSCFPIFCLELKCEKNCRSFSFFPQQVPTERSSDLAKKMAVKSVLYLLQHVVEITARPSKGPTCRREMDGSYFWQFAYLCSATQNICSWKVDSFFWPCLAETDGATWRCDEKNSINICFLRA